MSETIDRGIEPAASDESAPERPATGRPRLYEADQKLNAMFTYTQEARAQQYESSSPDTSRGPEESLMSPRRRKERADYVETRALFDMLARPHQLLLTMIYGEAADAISTSRNDDETEKGDAKVGHAAYEMGRLRHLMRPSPGTHGSFIRLAASHPLAHTAHRSRHPGKEVSYGEVVRMLLSEANPKGDGPPKTNLLKNLRDRCEAMRDDALRAFDEILSPHQEGLRRSESARRRAEEAGAAELKARAQEVKAARGPVERRHPSLRWSAEDRAKYAALAAERIAELQRFIELPGGSE